MLLCTPCLLISHYPGGYGFWYTYRGFSASFRDFIDSRCTFYFLFFVWNIMQYEAFWLLCISIWGMYHTVQYCIVGTSMSGGHGPQKISLSSPSGIIHGHLIVLVRHKQTQMCLQSNLKCYERISKKF